MPARLPAPVLDSHTHIDIVSKPGWGPAEQIEAAAMVGVDRLVQVGVDVESSRWAVGLAEEHASVVATVALHPNDAPRVSNLDESLRLIAAMAEHERVRA